MVKTEIISSAAFKDKVVWAQQVLELRDIQLLNVVVDDNSIVMLMCGSNSYKDVVLTDNLEHYISVFERMVFHVLNNAGSYAKKVDTQVVVYRMLNSKLRKKFMAFLPEVPVERDYVTAFSLENGFEVVPYSIYQNKTEKCLDSESNELQRILTNVIFADTALKKRNLLSFNMLKKSWDYYEQKNSSNTLKCSDIQ